MRERSAYLCAVVRQRLYVAGLDVEALDKAVLLIADLRKRRGGC